MKGFFKIVFGTMVGIILLWIISFFLIFMMGIAMLASSSSGTATPPNSILMLDLDGVINERVEENQFENILGSSSVKTFGLNDILTSVNKAKEDPNIEGIYLNINSIQSSYATLSEVRNALKSFRETGKFIYTYSTTLSQGTYYLATVSDSIFLNPQGNIAWRGLLSEVMFFKDLFKKLEIEPQIIRHGEYKGAVEPFILDKMSAANREQIEVYVRSIWESLCSEISTSRNISNARLNQIADSLSLLFDTDIAVKENFVDVLAYKDEFDLFLNKKMGLDSSASYKTISIREYKKNIVKTNKSSDKIALIYAAGSIVDGKGGNNEIGTNIAAAIAEARQSKSIKAIVLRVNSGGGSALMSDIIWREVALAKEEKPVVVSMGDYAASGGYYIACAADYIVAQPTTITGSIGVFGMIPNVEKLLSNKLGITLDRVKTNAHSDALSVTRPMGDYERKVITKGIESTYDTFLARVSKGRTMPTEEVDKVAQGRVWTGADAVGIGLVDSIGGLDVAIAIAAQKAGLENYSIVEKPAMKNFMEVLLESWTESRIQKEIKETDIETVYQYYQYLESTLKIKGIQARMPYLIDIQ